MPWVRRGCKMDVFGNNLGLTRVLPGCDLGVTWACPGRNQGVARASPGCDPACLRCNFGGTLGRTRVWQGPSGCRRRLGITGLMPCPCATPDQPRSTPGFSGSTRDCSGCPPGVEKGVAGRHVSAWVPPGLRGSPPARRRALPGVRQRQTKVYPGVRRGYAREPPRLHRGNTRATPD